MSTNHKTAQKPQKNSNRVRFQEFAANVYLPHVRARKRSWNIDERVLRRHIYKYFINLKLREISFGDIENWLNSLIASGLAPATCNRFLAVMKSVFSLAEARGYVPVSPCRRVKNLKTGFSREKHLTPGQSQKLLAALERHNCAEALALRLIILTGARKNEILKARWENVNLSERVLTIPLAKSGRTGRIFLSSAAVEIIKAIPRASLWLFPAARDKSKPLADIYYFWNKIRLKLNLKEFRVHDLRHTFASALINSGHSLFETQRILGHSDPATTMRYAHLGQRALLQAVDEAAQVLRWGERQNRETEIKGGENNFMRPCPASGGETIIICPCLTWAPFGLPFYQFLTLPELAGGRKIMPLLL